jgi:tetratricopeptide (TPR) repeat protein
MGTRGILDTSRNSRLTKIIVLCTLTLFFFSCSHIPKIIVLHDPLTADEHLFLGLNYELKGEFDSAIKEYKKGLKKDKKDHRPLFYLGNAYYKKREYEKAEKFYIKALDIAQDNSDIRNNISWLYIDTNRFDDALKEIYIALTIKMDPNYLDTLANIYYKIEKYDAAIKTLQDALAITPSSDTNLLYNEYRLLGDALEKMGRIDASKEAREKAEEYIKGIQ